MNQRFKYLTSKLILLFVTSMMLNFNFTIETKAATNSDYENELKAIIDKYGEGNIIVGNGIVIESGQVREIDNNFEENNKWVSNNKEIIAIEGNIITPISNGTTFIVRENEGMAYIEEVEVVNPEIASYSINAKSSQVNRNYYKVFIDPGHGGVDPGAVANGVRESDLNLIISEKVKSKLQSKNVEVLMSRNSDITVALGERAKMANSYDADTIVSIHQNSATPSASGIETFYQQNKVHFKPFADKIQQQLIARTGAINRGSKPEDFNVLRTSNMASALVECGFITNWNDVSKLKDDNYREVIASAIAEGVYSYLLENIMLAPSEGKASVGYSTHIEDYGWQGKRYDGKLSGTVNEAKRLEAISISIDNLPEGSGVVYRTHVEDYGWQPWKKDGEMAGTTGEGKRLEGIEIKLENVPAGYSVIYRTHVQDYGWQPWKKDGEMAGTTGEGRRLEAIEIKLISDADVIYQSHVAFDGWQDWKANGAMAGTTWQGKQMEAIRIKLDTELPMNVVYRSHVQYNGWHDWKRNGEMSGTEGQGMRLEAVEIKLEGAPSGYHIEYRAHVENDGWQDWVRDGQLAGTTGRSLRVEAIEIRIVVD